MLSDQTDDATKRRLAEYPRCTPNLFVSNAKGTKISRRDIFRIGASGIVAGATLGASLLESRVAEADVVAWKYFQNPTQNFTTSSSALIKSNLPVNPSFIKQYDSTYIWVVCAIDQYISNANPGTSMFNSVMLDDSSDVLQISVASFDQSLVVVDMSDILGGISAGAHNFPIYVAVNSGTGTWLMPVASYKVLELALPAPQS